MNLAAQIAGYRDRGFTGEQAEVITMMRLAAGVLFQDFPGSFLLFGGASLVAISRQCASLRRFGLAAESGQATNVRGSSCLACGRLDSAADALNLGPLQAEVLGDKILVKKRDNSLLFKVDITRFGSVLENEVEEHAVEIDEGNVAKVKAASRDLLLLQKAECFLLRKIMKARDPFDIYRLRQSGVVLNEQLENHLEDTLMGYEIEATDITARIAQVDEKRCSELRALLPSEVFESLAKEQFSPLRDALRDLYRRWL